MIVFLGKNLGVERDLCEISYMHITDNFYHIDYYAFGSLMPGRYNTPSETYRYGFNGKEEDPEGMGGGKSTYDYGFRIYNPAIARFLSVDPLTHKYPMLTPYQFASNTPIAAIDLDGLEGVIVIEMVNQPKGLNRVEFAKQIKERLVENGAHPDTKVVYSSDYGYFESISDSWGNKYKKNQSGTVTIKNFTLGKDRIDAGGYAELGSHKAVVYKGLSPFGEKGNTIPMYKYVNAVLHELGHAIYSFNHDENGDTESGVGLMDYKHTYTKGANFDQYQQKIISMLAYGLDGISGAAEESQAQNTEGIQNLTEDSSVDSDDQQLEGDEEF